MSTFMKKKDDETWTEWNNRWFNDQDKLDYIEEYIYEYTVWGGKGREITDLLLNIGVEDLIPLLESEELLDEKIEEAYRAVREFEEYKMSEEEEMFEEDCLSACMRDEAWYIWRVKTFGVRTKKEKEERKERREQRKRKKREEEEKEEKVDKDEEEEKEENRYDEEDDDDYKQPVKPVRTLTVAEMIEALSKLPPDAKLVMTESGFYSDVEFAEVMLPEPYIVGTRKTDYKPDMPDGTQVYRIGHSKQWY